MANQKWKALEGKYWWVVVDGSSVVALITGCRRGPHAQRIASAFFPELPGVQALAWFGQADAKQRTAAKQAWHITPKMCERAGVAPPPNGLPKIPEVGDHVKRLQKHFTRVAAAGGGR